MPMIDLTYPEGAIAPEAQPEVIERLTAALLRNEGAPDNERTRAMTWTFLHELPAGAVNVAARPVELPVYRIEITVPEGTLLHGPGPFGASARRNLVRDVTEILLEAEPGDRTSADRGRVYCLIREIPDGCWGALGTTVRMEEIASIAADEGSTPLGREATEAIDALLAVRAAAG